MVKYMFSKNLRLAYYAIIKHVLIFFFKNFDYTHPVELYAV